MEGVNGVCLMRLFQWSLAGGGGGGGGEVDVLGVCMVVKEITRS